jgi:putative acetyltransferase
VATDDPLHDPRFIMRPPGRFMDRIGPYGREAPRSNKKLCIVATDLCLLVDMLYGLSLRPDCAFVKYGTYERDGMYLGRVFLATDAAAAQLCEALKGHARVLVSVQDDDFFNAFRTTPPEPGACGVYEDWPEHASRVAEIHTEAFGRPSEAAIVAAVIASAVPVISLIAEIDRVVVGHVLLSPVTLDDRDDPRGLGLAPLAVMPSHQRRGVGEALVRAALDRARELGYAYVVVLGEPRYYARFGFVPASRFGFRCVYPAPDEAFMALELHSGALNGAKGLVRYQPALAV